MRRIAILFLLCALPAFAGCDDKDARHYATELTNVLGAYGEQVETKVTAEKASYKELAQVYERARQRNIEQMLEEDRIESSEKLAVSMAQAKYLPRNPEVIQSLHDYADRDFAATREFLQVEADAMAQFLGDIEALEFEAETIDELGAALKTLAKPKGNLKRLKDAAKFAQDTKAEFDKLVCNDVADALKEKTATLATRTAERDAIQKELKALNDAPSQDHEAIDAVTDELKSKEEGLNNLRRDIKNLKEQQAKCPK